MSSCFPSVTLGDLSPFNWGASPSGTDAADVWVSGCCVPPRRLCPPPRWCLHGFRELLPPPASQRSVSSGASSCGSDCVSGFSPSRAKSASAGCPPFRREGPGAGVPRPLGGPGSPLSPEMLLKAVRGAWCRGVSRSQGGPPPQPVEQPLSPASRAVSPVSPERPFRAESCRRAGSGVLESYAEGSSPGVPSPAGGQPGEPLFCPR